MIEKKIITWFNAQIPSVPAYFEAPTPKPKEYILLRVIDVDQTNHIDACTLVCESISTTMLKASELNERVKDIMENFISVKDVSACRLVGGGQNNDIDNKVYRYEAEYNIYYME